VRTCDQPDVTTVGAVTAYRCGELWDVYIGTHKIARVEERMLGGGALHAPSGRGALTGDELVVFEDGKPIARTKKHPRTHVTFEDRDHLIVVAEAAPGLWRWTYATDHWEPLAPVTKPFLVEVAEGGLVIATLEDTLVFVQGTTTTRVPVEARVAYLGVTADRRWVAAQLTNGTTLIVDGRTGAIARAIEQSDTVSAAPAFDPLGDLVMRPGRGGLTIWDRATGDAVIWGLDLLHQAYSGRFDAQGRIELAHWEIGLLDLQIDRRPAPEIVREIACRVPLRVVDGRLGPATPECAPP
jgi:hypothetical protein